MTSGRIGGREGGREERRGVKGGGYKRATLVPQFLHSLQSGSGFLDPFGKKSWAGPEDRELSAERAACCTAVRVRSWQWPRKD